MIRWNCTGCGRSLKANDEVAGDFMRCPQCKTTQEVPRPTAPTQASEAESEAAARRAAGRAAALGELAPPASAPPSDKIETLDAIFSSDPRRGIGVVMKAVWVLYILAVGFIAFTHSLIKFESAVQQAGAAADAAFWVIAGYAICRAFDSIERQ